VGWVPSVKFQPLGSALDARASILPVDAINAPDLCSEEGTLVKSFGCAIELTSEAARAAFVEKALDRKYAGFSMGCAEFWVII
jgi:hypothetical protein